MAIARFENATVSTVTNSVDEFGQYTTVTTPLFTSRALVKDVRNSLKIADKYREYQDLVNLTFNYTPATKRMVDFQHEYAITWRNGQWRITDCFESDDRMRITFMCYRADPNIPV